jgi:hypothetical protein
MIEFSLYKVEKENLIFSLNYLYNQLVYFVFITDLGDGETFIVRFVFCEIFNQLFGFSINVISITWRPLTNLLANGKYL